MYTLILGLDPDLESLPSHSIPTLREDGQRPWFEGTYSVGAVILLVIHPLKWIINELGMVLVYLRYFVAGQTSPHEMVLPSHARARSESISWGLTLLLFGWALRLAPLYAMRAPGGWPSAFLAVIIIEVAVSVYNVFNFNLNHESEKTVGMILHADQPIAEGEAQDWAEHQLRTAVNIEVAAESKTDWREWLMNQYSGGLSMQVEHHLFPHIHFDLYPLLKREVVLPTLASMKKAHLYPARLTWWEAFKHHLAAYTTAKTE